MWDWSNPAPPQNEWPPFNQELKLYSKGFTKIIISRQPKNHNQGDMQRLIKRVNWLEIKVTDMKQAITFYRDILGLKIKNE